MSKLYSGAEIVFKCLEDQDVKFVFGYPGGAVLPIYDELKNFNSVKHILVRHEQGAGHAAEGYARSTGKPKTNSTSWSSKHLNTISAPEYNFDIHSI